MVFRFKFKMHREDSEFDSVTLNISWGHLQGQTVIFQGQISVN